MSSCGKGNVCISMCRDRRYNKIECQCAVYPEIYAMQSKLTLSLLTFWDNDSIFIYYALAINNKLLFFSMQNHYTLLSPAYCEEEREMFLDGADGSRWAMFRHQPNSDEAMSANETWSFFEVRKYGTLAR